MGYRPEIVDASFMPDECSYEGDDFYLGLCDLASMIVGEIVRQDGKVSDLGAEVYGTEWSYSKYTVRVWLTTDENASHRYHLTTSPFGITIARRKEGIRCGSRPKWPYLNSGMKQPGLEDPKWYEGSPLIEQRMTSKLIASRFDTLVSWLSSMFKNVYVSAGYRKCANCGEYRHFKNWESERCEGCQVAVIDARNDESKRPEYVYVARAIGFPYYKIGRSFHPEKRVSTLSVALPFEIDTVAKLKVSDSVTMERHLHEKFAHKRMNGEWFNLDDEDIREILNIREEKT